MHYSDLITPDLKYHGKLVTDDLIVQLYDKGLLTDDDYLELRNSLKESTNV